MIESLSIHQARKLVLLSQWLPPQKLKGKAIEATLSAIEHLGYAQIDTISVIQRAHHHTLWNRNPRYNTSHLDQLVAEKRVFEYWAHAAAYLPMRDYRFSLLRKRALVSGKQKHWYKKDVRLMKEVLNRIGDEGPLMAKDFENTEGKTGDWKSKPAKRALECLFMQGDLMVSSRHHFRKVYDLTERVLPTDIDTTLPCPEEYTRHLIIQYLQANGLGQVSEIGYLLKNTRSLIERMLKEMVLAGEVKQLFVGTKMYYALPAYFELLGKKLNRSTLKILSPFDNLLIQRKRMQALFDFGYLLECYLPTPKRQYGYFSLPILWNGTLVARMDCKAERKKSLFHIQHLALEGHCIRHEEFFHALARELQPFIEFNECRDVLLHRTTPEDIKDGLSSILNGGPYL